MTFIEGLKELKYDEVVQVQIFRGLQGGTDTVLIEPFQKSRVFARVEDNGLLTVIELSKGKRVKESKYHGLPFSLILVEEELLVELGE